MQKTDCFSLGYIRRTVKNDGSIIAFFDVDDPRQYAHIDAVLVETKTGLIPYLIDKISLRPNNEAMIHFQDMNSDEEANTLKGKALWLPLELLPKLSGNRFYFHEVMGWQVVDEQFGAVGVIKDIFDNVQYPLFQIIHASGKEVLIPVTDAVIRKVDRSKNEIRILAPEGLIEMYVDDNQDDRDE